MLFSTAMKKALSSLVIVGLLIIDIQLLTAQNKTADGKLFYFELGGPGVVMSANFDSRFKSNTRYGFGYRLGVGVIPPFGSIGENTNSESSYNSSGVINVFEAFREMIDTHGEVFDFYYKTITQGNYTFPVGINYVFGRPNKASLFEIGAGITYLSRKASIFNWDVKKQGNMIGHLSFMYRFKPLNNGFSFRGGFTPVIGTAGDLYPMAAIGLGYAF